VVGGGGSLVRFADIHTCGLRHWLSRGSCVLQGGELRLRPCCRLRGLLLLLVGLPFLEDWRWVFDSGLRFGLYWESDDG
jgi:hypothetical protein